MFKIKGPVLAAAAFDQVTEEVIRQADALARSHKVGLCICHVLAEICAVRPLFPYLHMDDALKVADLEGSIHKALSKTVHAAISRSAAHVSILIEQGTVHAGILHAADRIGAGAVVIGKNADNDGMPVLSGTADRVTRHADCPVLLVRPSPAGIVLAATDFSDPSLPAIAAGAAEADRRHTDMTIVHAIDMIPAPMPAIDGVSNLEISMEVYSHIRQASQEELDKCVKRFDAKGGGLLYEGSAVEAILNTASKLHAQLIVVGTHGRTGLSRVALGSVAEAVLRSAPCSAMVVRVT